MPSRHTLLRQISPRPLLTVLLLVLTAAFAHAQAYTNIVVIGDSLSDTGNDYHVSNALYTAAAAVPGPATGYTLGRFTDGTTDTLPMAVLYKGVWVEQLAAMLAAKPPVVDSLDGGTNYAYGFAFTGTGTTAFTYGPGNALSFPVNNMGLQLSTYLATNPVISSKTLYVIWGGANDLLNATSSAQISTAVTNELGIIQTLITAGATDFLVVNLPPLGDVPRINTLGAATITAANQSAAAFNQGLATGLAALPAANTSKTLHIFPLDVYTLFNNIIANPSTYGFKDVTDAAQGQAVNPDTYLFWDSLHPTTAGHHLIATSALALIAPTATTTTVTSSALSANVGASVTFTATVKANTGTPTGVVTFYDGNSAIGMGQLSGTATDTATYTTSTLAAGTHSITASYGLSTYFAPSTSTAISEVISAPAFSASASPSSLTISDGSTGTTTVSIASVGGYSGTVSLACGTLPAHVACLFSPSTLTFAGANNTLTSTLVLNTASAALLIPARPGASLAAETILACSLLPLSLLALRRRHGRRLRGIGILSLLLLSGAAVTSLTGCGSTAAPARAPTGTYTVPVTVSAGSNVSTLNLTVTIQ